MEAVLENLAEAIAAMRAQNVPPPQIYKGVGSIEDFFTRFEKYAAVQYQNDEDSYLTVLPNFLEGEPQNLVTAFGTGTGITYQEVKEKVIQELKSRKTLGANDYTEFFAAKRRNGETLVCFCIIVL